MRPDEMEWLNAYHAQVRLQLIPLMKQYFPESVDYLISNTEPIITSFFM